MRAHVGCSESWWRCRRRLGSHGEPPADKPKPPAAARELPAELDALNAASRKMYAGARTRELSTIPVVIVVSGDDLVLRKNGKRTAVTVIPAEYHALKSVAHTTLSPSSPHHVWNEPGKTARRRTTEKV